MTRKFGLRVGITGPSGSGKTTLAKFIEETLALPYIPGSAGCMISKKDKKYLKHEFGYKGKGHLHVIKKSLKHPEFGMAFQAMLLEGRVKTFTGLDQFVTDRTIFDNIVYSLLQCSFTASDDELRAHLYNCSEQLKLYTHIIFVPTLNPLTIESNGSRIDKFGFQKYVVTPVFQNYISEMSNNFVFDKVKFLRLDNWDLDQRKKAVIDFLK